MKLKKFIKKFLSTKPEFFCTLALLYLLAGALAIFDPYLREINPALSLDPLTVLVWFFGLFSFFLGLKYHRLLPKIRKWLTLFIFVLITIAFHYILDMGWLIAIVANLSVFTAYFVFFRLKNHFFHFFGIGAVIFVLNFFLVGLPLAEPLLHYQLETIINPIFLAGFYLMLFSLVKLYTQDQKKVKIYRILFFLLLFLTILSTYRSYIGFTIFTWLFLELGSSKKVGRNAFLWGVAIVLMMIMAFSLMGQFLQSSKGEWKLDAIRTLEYRPGFTLHIFDDLVLKSFPFGYSFGEATLKNRPGKFVCDFYNCRALFSSTVMGEMMLDFGLFGVFVSMFLIGGILQNIHKIDYPLYSLLMSHAIVAIENGANIFLLSLFVYIWYSRLSK